MISICCTQPKPVYQDLTADENQRFGFLVRLYRKQGYLLPQTQEKDYAQMWSEEIPFD